MGERQFITERQVIAEVTYVDGRRGSLPVTASLFSDRTATYRPSDGRAWEQIEGIEQMRLPTAFDDIWDD